MIIPSGFAQINLKWGGNDLPTGAEMTFAVNHTSFPGTPSDVADAVDTAFTTANIPTVFDNDISLLSILVKYGPNNLGPSFEKFVSHPGSAGSGGSLPSAAALIHKYTGIGGHAGKGRMFMPGVIASNYDNKGLFGPGHAEAITAVWESFRTKLVADGMDVVLLHGVHSPVTAPSTVSSFACDAKMATQRRRLRR